MTAGEIIDASLRLYQQLGLSFLRLTVVPALLCLSAVAFVMVYVLPGLLYSQDNGEFSRHIADVALAILMAVFFGGPLFMTGLSYTTALVVSLVSDYMVGNAVDPGAAQEVARRAQPRLLLVTFRELLLSLSGILVAGAVTLLGEWLTKMTPETSATGGIVVLLGLFGVFGGFMICLSVLASDALVAPVTVLEDLGPKMAGKRARALMKKVPFHGPGTAAVWSVYILIGFMVVVLWGGIEICFSVLEVPGHFHGLTSGLPLQPIFQKALELLPAFIAIWTVIPVWATTVTMLYYDRRIRLEGFDIEILGRDLARSSRTSRFEL
ncbi:hypothetical protein OP10G_4756 [Fimbriimonas ginsengisoli Gsoil 348]|uniref:Uncharacterized protein n=2 Tax=Fimbriimonas ginsengisoli TaxID=1005039 RepID=A0A068NZ83_FIMGI|nr:hypothetical protein OP10G_4756 [Fimbriimonas ginsengisoli Gsoil 348]